MVVGRSYLKMILIEFRKSFGRFAAIFGIVALGVGFLSGLLITTPDMNLSVDTYYDDNNMADIFIKANMGLTLDDLEKVKAHEDVKEVMPAYVIDQLIQADNNGILTSKIYGLPLLDQDNHTIVNKLELLEGRMPKNNNECLVERKNPYLRDIKIGSSLKISEENKNYGDIDDLYEIDTYQVVGIVGNSFHFAKEREFSNIGTGSLDTIIYVDRSSYALEEYTDFYIVLEDAKEMDSFSAEYKLYSDKTRKSLEKLAKERSRIRKISIFDQANEKLEDGFDEYFKEKEKAEKELADALSEIEDGKQELTQAKIDINNAKIELQDGKNTLDKEFMDAEKEIQEAELDLNQAKSNLRLAEKELEEARIELEAGEKEYLEGYNSYLEGKKEVENGQLQIESAKEKLKESQVAFEAGKEQLKEAGLDFDSIVEQDINLPNKELAGVVAELKVAKNMINLGKKEVDENELKLSYAKEELDKANKEILEAREQLENGRKEYEDGLVKLQDGRKEYEDDLIQLEDAKTKLEKERVKALKEIEDGERDLQKGIIEYEDGIKEIEDAEIKYLDAKTEAEEELDDAYKDLMDAKAEIEDLEKPKWYVFDRDSNMGYVSFELNSEKVAAIAKVFPIFFYLVAGLVALTTMTRMVEEERMQIGILKSLGYEKITIIFKYILYSGLASILGSIFGQMIGFKIIPRVIWNTYGVMYHLPPFITDYNQKIALLSSGVAILATSAATFFAANGALKEKPATLMLPKAPKKGKRILLERVTPLWSIMSFNLKSTARNLFRYKKHFFMTIIGISGCTALLVTGFGIRDSIKDIGQLQFDEIFKYQLEIQLEDNPSEFITSKISNTENVSGTLEVFLDDGYLEFEDNSDSITLVAIEDLNKSSDYIEFRDRGKSEILEHDRKSIILTEKISERFGIQEGDTVTYEDSHGEKSDFQVDLIVENYIENYIYMSKRSYEVAFNKKVKNNTLYTKTEELNTAEEDQLIESLYEFDDVFSADFISQSRSMFDNLIKSINYIVVVIIIASGLLAFIVLYNLTNININERKRELATLKVLGFYNNEVAAYIFREITILALISTSVGLVLGKFLHRFIILTIEDPNFMFGRDISITSYIISAIITMLFSVIVDLFMVKKLKNIKMVDSMKAND